MRLTFLSRRSTLAVTLAALAATLGVVNTSPASAAACSDVDIVFARGTTEAPGLGITGGPFVSSLTSALSGLSVTSYAVNYAAAVDQSSAGPGGTDMSNHVSSVAAACPGTRFVLGGYSQGASVTDVAIGITGGGTAIPASLSSRVAAVVVFGNPLGIQGRTIATASPVYGPRSKDYCNTGDPVCGAGSNIVAHLQYASNGSTTAGAQFAAGLVRSGTPVTPPTLPPAPTPTAPPVTVPPTASPTPPVTSPPVTTPPVTTPPASPSCVTASTKAHVAAGRAVSYFWLTFAKGSNAYIGPVSDLYQVSLSQVSPTSWSKVAHC